MPGAKDENFDGLTVKYNGVQFGGTDGSFPSLPPTYDLDQRGVYDEAGRVITHVRHTLTVFCTFYEASEEELSDDLDEIRTRLMKAGEPLELKGLGIGFLEKTADQIWGPKPISFNYPRTHGVRSTDTVWVVEFNGPPCPVSDGGVGSYSAVNSQSRHSNDFEGRTTRTVTGYYEIPQSRSNGLFGGDVDADKGRSKPELDRVADGLRNTVKIEVPFGFRRIQNTWSGNKAKNRIDFTVIDEALPGRPYPIGITNVTNDQLEFSTDPFTATKGTVTLTATMTVSPEHPPSLAGVHFTALAAHKQNQMAERLNAAVSSKGTSFVLPTRLIIRSGIYDNARTTSFLAQWQTTGCLANILFHSPWAPIPGSNYQLWKTSVENLWRNSGNRDTIEQPAGDTIIRICDSISSYNTGQSPDRGDTPQTFTDPALLPCPEIPPESSWISYDVEVTYHEVLHDTPLRRMVDAFTDTASVVTGIGAPVTTALIQRLASFFDKDKDKDDIQSQNGKPQQFILIRAKGRRVNHNPVFPTLETVGGVKVFPTKIRQVTPSHVVAKFGNCTILEMKGYAWYRADDPISDYGPKDNPVLCATTQSASPDV